MNVSVGWWSTCWTSNKTVVVTAATGKEPVAPTPEEEWMYIMDFFCFVCDKKHGNKLRKACFSKAKALN